MKFLRIFFLTVSALLLTTLPVRTYAESSAVNANNLWWMPSNSLPACAFDPIVSALRSKLNTNGWYFTSPAEAQVVLMSVSGVGPVLPDFSYTGTFSGGRINFAATNCSISHMDWQVQYQGSNFGQVCLDGSYQEGSLSCVGKSLGARCPGSCKVGNPIDVGSGNKFEEAVDYETAGQNKLRFVRYYNSRGSLTSLAVTLGKLWRSNFDRYLNLLSPTSVLAERSDGQELIFTLTGTVWSTDSDADVTLANSGSTWTLIDHDDTVETYTANSAGTAAIFNSSKARNGYTQTLSYSSGGQLTSVNDSYGRSLSFTYSGGLLSTISTPDSTTITLAYTAASDGANLTSVTYFGTPSATITYSYGSSTLPNALTSITDENGNTFAAWTYDGYSRGLTSAHGGSGINAGLVTLTYNDTTGTRTVTNALGVVDTYTFTTLQGVPKVTQISRAATSSTAAATRTFSYDSNGFLASQTDWNGNSTTYVNNSHGLPTTINKAVGSAVSRTTTISYDPTFVHLPAAITTPSLTTTLAYDASGNLHTRTDMDTTTQTVPYSTNGQARTWTFTYSNFLLASVQNPRTDVTVVTNFGYGADGALTSITDALTHAVNITSHTGGGRPLTIIDPNNVTTTLAYDARQRITSSSVSTSAGARTTTYTRDPAGQLTQVTLPDNSFIAYTYDTAHRVTKITDALTHFLQYTLDALGDITSVGAFNSSTDQRYQHSATFDALGRKLTDVGASGQTTTNSYDANGNALTILDPLSHQTTQAFDALNRLSTVTGANTPAPGVTTFAYDAHDRTASVTDANGHATSYVYDGFGDVIQQASPDSGTTVYHYDPDSNLTQKVDALGVTTNYTYDGLDRVIHRNYPADSTQNLAYTYDKTGGLFGDGIGRLSTMTDAAGFVNLLYDERGNLLSTRRYNSAGTVNLSNVYAAYDAASRIKDYTYPDGTLIAYTRDAAGNISKVQLLPSGASTYQTVGWPGYYPFGPQKFFTFGNGIGEALTRNMDYNVTQVTDTVGSTTLRNVTYGLDAASNVNAINDAITPSSSQTLGYDALNRLTSAVSGPGGYGSLSWTYDKVGNLLTQTAGSSTASYGYTTGTNQLASIKNSGATTVTTNANGNITSIPSANGGAAATFSYNVANRLSSVSGSPLGANFLYDGFGQRFSKTNPGGNPINYNYDLAGNLIAENNNGTVTDYIYANGRPIGVFSPGTATLYFVHTDNLGTPQMVTDGTQAVVWSTTYQPYGTTGPITSSMTQNLRLPGQYFDGETGFHYNGFRDYMPGLGRYLESDPIGLGGGLNTYRYANANPMAFVDPSGLDILSTLSNTTADQARQAALAKALQDLGMSQEASNNTAKACVAAYNVYTELEDIEGFSWQLFLLRLAEQLGADALKDAALKDLRNDPDVQQIRRDLDSKGQSIGQSINQWINSAPILQKLNQALTPPNQR